MIEERQHQEVLEIIILEIIIDTQENTGSIGMVVDIGVKKAEEETESAMNVGIMMNIVEALKEEYIMQLSRAYQKIKRIEYNSFLLIKPPIVILWE
ncbi:hypothetical protein [Chlamydia pecorum]|uniref:hypothetical protein n=2 Tax=Chlamydia pecorum TaxID=85991 RepID=UPI00388D10BF